MSYGQGGYKGLYGLVTVNNSLFRPTTRSIDARVGRMAKRLQPGFSPSRSKNRFAHRSIALLAVIADPSASAPADQPGVDQTIAILKRQDEAILRVGER